MSELGRYPKGGIWPGLRPMSRIEDVWEYEAELREDFAPIGGYGPEWRSFRDRLADERPERERRMREEEDPIAHLIAPGSGAPEATMDVAARLAAMRARAAESARGGTTPPAGPAETGEAREGRPAPTPEDHESDRHLADPPDFDVRTEIERDTLRVTSPTSTRCTRRPIGRSCRPSGRPIPPLNDPERPPQLGPTGPVPYLLRDRVRRIPSTDAARIEPSTDAAELVESFGRPSGKGEPLVDAPSGERRTCRSPRCGAEVIWHVAPTTGKGHPLETEVLRGRLTSPADPKVPADQLRRVILASGRSVQIVLDPAGDMLGRESHFAHCPDGPGFRREK